MSAGTPPRDTSEVQAFFDANPGDPVSDIYCFFFPCPPGPAPSPTPGPNPVPMPLPPWLFDRLRAVDANNPDPRVILRLARDLHTNQFPLASSYVYKTVHQRLPGLEMTNPRLFVQALRGHARALTAANAGGAPK